MNRSDRSDRMKRREFLASLMAAGVAGGLNGKALAVLGGDGEYLSADKRIIFKSSFEPGQPLLKAAQHKLVEGVARTGKRSMLGRVDLPNRACFLEVPFSSRKGHIIHVSFWVRSDKGSACSVFVRVGQKRTALGRRVDRVPSRTWRRVEAKYEVEQDTTGVIQIVAPSSHSAPMGQAWIDDVLVYEVADETNWPDHVQDFPALACDGAGNIWLAAVERPESGSSVAIYRLDGSKRSRVCAFKPEGTTGIGAPAIAGLDKGCAVVFAVEQNDRWRIACGFVDDSSRGDNVFGYFDCGGSANISPAIAAVGKGAYCVWESNAGRKRGIYGCALDRNRVGEIAPISSPDANSYNPSIVTLADGSLFAAWDSVQSGSADIYGAFCCDGRWGEERRITRDVRIERHPSLAVWKNQVWMAWQAQSYPAMKINNVDEQRIVVARIDDGPLKAPHGMFDEVSPKSRLLVRPQIAFDESGRLLLTARQSISRNDGWRPVVWRYSGRQWQGPWIPMSRKGRWRPVSLAIRGSQNVVCSQYDDVPGAWAERGIHPDWKWGLSVKDIGVEGQLKRPETQSLKMPDTEFSLAEKIEICSAHLPRNKKSHGSDELTLYWGDFHDHTDISVCARDKNPPGHDLFANERDIEKLDFCALTDHGYNFDRAQWEYNGEQTRNNHDPGRFVTFLAEEWTSSKNPPAPGGKMNRYGHRNLIFKDPYHTLFYDSFDGDISPAELWKELEGHEFICIPHQLADWKGKGGGNPPTDWSFVDEKLQPVAEIFQARQSYEYLGCPRQAPQGAPFKGNYLQDAWAKGIVIGVIASPDHGGGNGKVGVWAKELTRDGIFDAVRARHTFGTSGAKMALFFKGGGVMMGDKVRRPSGPIEFEIDALAMRAIREVVIFRNNEIVFRAEPGDKKVELRWTDEKPLDVELAWYYARIHAEDDELAWSSPIWFKA